MALTSLFIHILYISSHYLKLLYGGYYFSPVQLLQEQLQVWKSIIL